MNSLRGNIIDIQVCDNISLVKIQCGDSVLSSIIIETPSTISYLREGNSINVLFKETEVIIAKKGEYEISLQNQLPCLIEHIKKGQLLSRIKLKFNNTEIRSIITSNAVNKLELEEGMEVLAMIKTNEIMLSQL